MKLTNSGIVPWPAPRPEPDAGSADAAGQGFEALYAGRFGDAAGWFEQALNGPAAGDLKISLALAEARLYEGRFDEAERIGRDLIGRDPGDLQTRALLGLALVHLDRPDEALRFLARAPDHPAVHLGRATAMTRLGEFVDAEAATRQALKLAPESAEAYLALGTALTHQKRFGEALAALTKATKYDPDNVAARQLRDQVLRHLGQSPAPA